MKKLSLHILVILLPVFLFSQTTKSNLVLYQLTEQNGLSDNQVTCFFQDSYGFMWIGTQDGLNRYDGSVIKTFKAKRLDSSGLAGNYITAITEDSKHHLWIGTISGLSEYDPQTNQFWIRNKTGLTDLCFDGNDNLWIGSWTGLSKYSFSQNKFTSYSNQTSNDALSLRNNNRINKIVIDDKKRIWLAAYSGLWKFEPASKTCEHIRSTENKTVDGLINDIYKDHAGNLWLAFWDHGLHAFNPDNYSIENYSNAELPVNIFGITETKNLNGKFSVWTNGLVEIDATTKQSTKYEIDQSANSKLFTSRDGLLWIGTDNGVRIMDPLKQFFHSHFISSSAITPQSIAVFQNNKYNLIGGAGENFLNLYDSNFHFVKKIIDQPVYHLDGQTVKPALLNIVREDDHRLWLCTEHGLFLYDERSRSTQLFQFTQNDISIPTRNFINNVFIDSKGRHWVFPWRSGIWQLDVERGKFKKIIPGLTTENNDLKKLVISSAVEDSHGNIWFGDLDEGLIRYDAKTGVFSKPTEKLFGSLYSLSNIILEGEFTWCVKSGNVFRVNTSTTKIDQWDVPDEFNKNVTGFCSDHSGHLWITTNSGLLMFDKSKHDFKRFSANDGLEENVMSGTIFPEKNGKILYAAKNYITEFDPQELIKEKNIPPVIITNVSSQNQTISINKNDKGKFIDLGYKYDNFIFNWAMLNYSNPLQNRYYCKLEGVDKDWRFVGYSGQSQYASLHPGKYTFHVKAATSEGLMNEQGDEVTIIIQPPFWQSWWFILTSSILIATSFIAFVRYVSQRNLKEKLLRLEKQQAVEKERNRISQDMHDDLGSGLTKIAIMSEVVKKQIHEPEKAKEQLENISASSRELVDNLQDIIWVLNPKNDTLESLAAYVREYSLKFFEPFDINIDFNYPEIFPDVKLSEEERRNIFLVIKETFNNIARHALCNRVMLSIQCENKKITIVVTDDGRGFNRHAVRQFGNGLTNMSNRIKQVGGIYEISSAQGTGTKTKIEIGV